MSAPTEGAATWLAYNAAENARDYVAMAALVAEDLTVQVNGVRAVGSAEDDLRAMEHLIGVYPDYRREVDEIIGAGDRVVARWRMRGTSADSAVEPLDVPGCSVVTVRGGRMTEAFLYYQGAALDRVLQTAGERS